MNISTRLLGLLCILFVIVPGTGQADGDSQSLTFYRLPSGEITEQSVRDGKTMRKLARKEGHITLWLTSGVQFSVSFESMSPEELEEQKSRVADEFSEVLGPMIEANNVWEPKFGRYIRGPGCVVRANAKGVRQLLHDERIVQIVAADQFRDQKMVVNEKSR